MLTEQLAEYGDIQVTQIEEPDYAVCSGALKIARDLPFEYWGQMGDMAIKDPA
jgi:hypothetical protein